MSSTYLQIFLFADVFIIGLLVPYIFRHANAHLNRDKAESTETNQPQLSPAAKERLLKASEDQFQKALNHSVDVLQHDLEASAGQINSLVTRFAGVIVGDEMERYRSELAKLSQQAATDMSSVKHAISSHQAEIEAAYKKELELEKERLLKQIDTKLGDAVGSFLIETLQHNVDLGNQAEYLVGMLEEHKADFTKEVAGGDTQLT